jgi:hypothetical protein
MLKSGSMFQNADPYYIRESCFCNGLGLRRHDSLVGGIGRMHKDLRVSALMITTSNSFFINVME